MAFGVNRALVERWKASVRAGDIAFLTHYWKDDRFPGCKTVTKAGCADVERLREWGAQYGLRPEWIDLHPTYPHFDLLGDRERFILQREGLTSQYERFYPQSLRPVEQFVYGLYHRSPYAVHLENERSFRHDDVDRYVDETTAERVRLLYDWIAPDDFIRLIVTLYTADGTYPTVGLHRWLDSSIRYDVKTNVMRLDDETGWTAQQFIVTGRRQSFDLERIVKRTVEADVRKPFKKGATAPSIFIEHLRTLTVFHSYDDRGFEIIAPSPAIEHEWRNV